MSDPARLPEACPRRRQFLATRDHLTGAGIGRYGVAAAVEGGQLVRVRRGVYSLAPLPERARHLVSGGSPDPAYVAAVRAALLSLGTTAIAGGRTAAALWGFDMLVEPSAVELVAAASRTSTPRKGVLLRRRRGAVATSYPVLGLEPLRVLTPVETVLDCAQQRPLREAVVVLDSALRSGRVTPSEVRQAVEREEVRPGGPRLRRVVGLADPASESVLESLLRLLLSQHGLFPESQVEVRDARGALIGRVDFLFRDQRLVVECDGRRWHDPADAREQDRIRDNELERAAWRLVRVTWEDVVHHPARVVALVRDCLQPWPVAA